MNRERNVMAYDFPTLARRQPIIRKGVSRRFMIGLSIGAVVASTFDKSVFASGPRKLVVLGDSLSAGYELPPDAAYPSQLEAALKGKGLSVVVENAGVSGDTSSGGLDRLDWSVADGTSGVIVALGANDALRGIDPAITRQNIETMITKLKTRKIAVFLIGMVAPPNNGEAYGKAFNALYAELAAKHGVPLYPFFLDGVMTVPGMQLPDGMHPTREGVAEMVKRTQPMIETWLAAMQ
jgi:acyl-CoA thioesterase I